MTQARENLAKMLEIHERTEQDLRSFELRPEDFGFEDTRATVPASDITDPYQRAAQIAFDQMGDLLEEATARLILHEREMAQ